jgi:hypothetical protein
MQINSPSQDISLSHDAFDLVRGRCNFTNELRGAFTAYLTHLGPVSNKASIVVSPENNDDRGLMLDFPEDLSGANFQIKADLSEAATFLSEGPSEFFS